MASQHPCFPQPAYGRSSVRPPRRRGLSLAAAVLLVGLSCGPAQASLINIDWLSYAPALANSSSSPPISGQSYVATGSAYGPVIVTYSAVAGSWATTRLVAGSLQSGSVSAGGDTYQWASHEAFGRTYYDSSPLDINQGWDITFTFTGAVPTGGDLVLGVLGLGRRTPNNLSETAADTMSLATVNTSASYTHLGDYFSGNNWGATLATSLGPGAGFTLQNSTIGSGGSDPWWNTELHLTRFDSPLPGNSLTVHFDHTLGDGLAVNIGFLSSNQVPEPGSAALAAGALAALALSRRRATKT